MNVGRLIEHLQTIPPDTPVVIRDRSHGIGKYTNLHLVLPESLYWDEDLLLWSNRTSLRPVSTNGKTTDVVAFG